jgi:hypothetical protein
VISGPFIKKLLHNHSGRAPALAGRAYNETPRRPSRRYLHDRPGRELLHAQASAARASADEGARSFERPKACAGLHSATCSRHVWRHRKMARVHSHRRDIVQQACVGLRAFVSYAARCVRAQLSARASDAAAHHFDMSGLKHRPPGAPGLHRRSEVTFPCGTYGDNKKILSSFRHAVSMRGFVPNLLASRTS